MSFDRCKGLFDIRGELRYNILTCIKFINQIYDFRVRHNIFIGHKDFCSDIRYKLFYQDINCLIYMWEFLNIIDSKYLLIELTLEFRFNILMSNNVALIYVLICGVWHYSIFETCIMQEIGITVFLLQLHVILIPNSLEKNCYKVYLLLYINFLFALQVRFILWHITL